MTLITRFATVAALFFTTLSAFGADDGQPQPFKLWKDVPPAPLKPLAARAAERVQLPNGMVLFLLEDHELPLIEASLMIRAGELHETADGVAAATLTVLRSGGSAQYPGDKLDQILERVAAEFGASTGLDYCSARLATLKEDFDKGLDVFVDVLRNPAFPQDKLELYQSQARTQVSKRNDTPGGIAFREFRKAVYGEKSPYAKTLEYAHINRLDRAALQAFHQKHFQPGQFILGVAGDFKKEEMAAKLTKIFSAWPGQASRTPEPPSINTTHSQKNLYCERPGINQTSVVLGHVLDMRHDSRDYPAVRVLNEILSGGMSARLFSEVRTRKGLAYSVGGHASVNYTRPGLAMYSVLTRNEQALEAAEAVRAELARMRDNGVTEQEVAEARESILNAFVFGFDTPAKILNRQMTYELFGYPMNFAETQMAAVKQVRAEDVNKAAKKYLDPEKCVLVAVGNFSGLEPGKSFAALKNAQKLDVTIPQMPTEPMVIDPAREKNGRKILKDCIKAAGGVKAFQEITSIQAQVVLQTRGMKLKGCMRAVLPEKVRVDISGPFGAITQIINNESAWKATGEDVHELSPREALSNLRIIIQSDLGLMRMLAAGTEGYNVQALDPMTSDGVELIGVEIESESLSRIKVWFDARTKLIARIQSHGDDLQKDKAYDKRFSGHEKFGKLTLARNLTEKDQSIELRTLRINPPLDASLFACPEKAAYPPKD
jgi:zinc protease